MGGCMCRVTYRVTSTDEYIKTITRDTVRAPYRVCRMWNVRATPRGALGT